MHEAQVLRHSAIFWRAEGGDILFAPTVNISGNEIGTFLGIVHIPSAHDRDEIKFNKELSYTRVKVKCTFSFIKSRWRVLQKRFDSTIDFAVKNAIACPVLHNLCIQLGDNWEEDCDDDKPCPPIMGLNVWFQIISIRPMVGHWKFPGGGGWVKR